MSDDDIDNQLAEEQKVIDVVGDYGNMFDAVIKVISEQPPTTKNAKTNNPS